MRQYQRFREQSFTTDDVQVQSQVYFKKCLGIIRKYCLSSTLHVKSKSIHVKLLTTRTLVIHKIPDQNLIRLRYKCYFPWNHFGLQHGQSI